MKLLDDFYKSLDHIPRHFKAYHIINVLVQNYDGGTKTVKHMDQIRKIEKIEGPKLQLNENTGLPT